MADTSEIGSACNSAILASIQQGVQNATAHQLRLQNMAEQLMGVTNAAAASAIKGLVEMDPAQAAALGLVGNTGLSAGQQGAKIAQSTAPETARPTTGADG